ncbi:MAG: nitroreductase family protein [Desulfosarcinaceae bacterium]|nr:nitroreductase family protein [Desulfosarcinaceae bacterium]
MDLIRSRRSIRRYAERPVEEEKIDLLMEAALRSPSSRGFNPWSFVIVRDRAMLTALAQAKPHGASFLAKAPLAFVICADPTASDVWVEDASIATLYLHLAASDLGLGSCWIQLRKRDHADGGRARDFVADQLGLPTGLEVLAMMAIGYPEAVKAPHPPESLLWEKISWERYGRARQAPA